MRVAFELLEIALEIQRQNILRERPAASRAEVERLLAAWMQDRPGAPDGDAAGTACHRDFGAR